ncbi:MAG: WD40-like beta Propeller containing protein [Solirubrobacterales bacterium]|nr:WD40-like beta Propeller containing protein [Solirubrobacterales bacterium]
MIAKAAETLRHAKPQAGPEPRPCRSGPELEGARAAVRRGAIPPRSGPIARRVPESTRPSSCILNNGTKGSVSVAQVFRRPVVWVSALALVIVALLSQPAAWASFPGADGVIAYTTNEGLWIVDPATSNEMQLTSDHTDAFPSFSPDGNTVAFQRGVGTGVSIFVIKSDGSSLRYITTGRQPVFSPDGNRLAFTRPEGLFVAGSSPGAKVRLVVRARGVETPAWSSRGRLAFEKVSPGRFLDERTRLFTHELDVVHAQGSPLLTRRVSVSLVSSADASVTDDPEHGLRPDWSPDGRSVAVSSCIDNLPPSLLATTSSPRLVPHFCRAGVWPPGGGGLLVEPGVAPLTPRQDTSCPNKTESEMTSVAYQSVTAATHPIPTIPCVPAMKKHGTEPSTPPAAGTTICLPTRRHKWVCVTLRRRSARGG